MGSADLTTLPVALLAGGLATRLRPITEKIPKSLVEISGEPFIAHQLRLLRSRGITRVVVLAGYLGEQIQAFVGDGARFGLEVGYVFDGELLRGTAGAIRNALPLLGEAFYTLYGDSYLECDYQDIARRFLGSGRQALMTVYRNEGQFDRSNVVWDGTSILVYDKKRQLPEMRHIDYGLGLFHAAAFEEVPVDRPADLSELYQRRLTEGQLVGIEVTERFYEIGSLAGITDLAAHLARRPFPTEARSPS